MKISFEDFFKRRELWKELKEKLVIYPTDTVYGLGCDAENEKLVEKIYEIKKRPRDKPLSVIAPGFKWIQENFECDMSIVRKFLPGAYTLVLKKKNPEFLKFVAPGESVGVRIPAHLISKVVEELGMAFVTTSANISGEKAPAGIEEVDKAVVENAELVIDGGKLPGKPSTIVDLTKEEVEIRERE